MEPMEPITDETTSGVSLSRRKDAFSDGVEYAEIDNPRERCVWCSRDLFQRPGYFVPRHEAFFCVNCWKGFFRPVERSAKLRRKRKP